MKAEECNIIFKKVIDDYHVVDNVDSNCLNPFKSKTLKNIMYEKCWVDTVQWHLEDIIRIPNINPEEGLRLIYSFFK